MRAGLSGSLAGPAHAASLGKLRAVFLSAEVLASFGPAQCPSCSFQVRVRWQRNRLRVSGIGIPDLSVQAPVSSQHMHHLWVRTGQLCKLAPSDNCLLGWMGWNLGYLLRETLIPDSGVPISCCSDCSKVGVSPIREREEEWKLDCQQETECS